MEQWLAASREKGMSLKGILPRVVPRVPGIYISSGTSFGVLRGVWWLTQSLRPYLLLQLRVSSFKFQGTKWKLQYQRLKSLRCKRIHKGLNQLIKVRPEHFNQSYRVDLIMDVKLTSLRPKFWKQLNSMKDSRKHMSYLCSYTLPKCCNP